MDKAREYKHEYTHVYKYKYICSHTRVHMNMLLHILEIISSCHTSSFHPSPLGLLFFPSFHFLKKLLLYLIEHFHFFLMIAFIYLLFIYFWLCWVFVDVLRLSLVVASGGYSSLWCTGFSMRWLLLLRSTGSRSVGFSSCSTWVQ